MELASTFLLYSVLVTLHHHHRILNKKTTLPIQDILGETFYVWGHSFQFGANFCGKNLKLLQGQILFFGGNFFGNCKSLFSRQIYFLGIISVWSIFLMENLKSLFWGKIFKIYEGHFFKLYRIIIFCGRQNFITFLALTKN